MDWKVKMKRLICYLLVVPILLSLCACSGKTGIVGIWEQEMEISILGEGVDSPTSAVSLLRFTFREDGTGTQEHIMMEEAYPSAVREFAWQLEEDTLTLDFEGDHTEQFAVATSQTSLKLENSRGKYDLTRAEP